MSLFCHNDYPWPDEQSYIMERQGAQKGLSRGLRVIGLNSLRGSSRRRTGQHASKRGNDGRLRSPDGRNRLIILPPTPKALVELHELLALGYLGLGVLAHSMMAMLSEIRFLRRLQARGFDPQALRPGHYGIVGLREQAELIGAELRIDSKPNAGTTVSFSLRLSPIAFNRADEAIPPVASSQR
jgi:hypothetical protein